MAIVVLRPMLMSLQTREYSTVQLKIGDVLRVPVVTDGQPATVSVYSLVIDDVLQTAEGRVYLLRDRSGPAVCVREVRLRWLQCRFERVLQGI